MTLTAGFPMHLSPALIIGLLLLVNSVARAADQEPITMVRGGLPHDALFDIAFSGNGGVAVGHHGAVLLSNDSGGQWQPQHPLTELALTAVTLGPAGVIIVGQQGTIFIGPSADNLHAVASPTTERLLSVAMDKAGLAVVVGGFGTVLISHDSGDNWSSVDIDWSRFNADGLEAHLYDVEIGPTGEIFMCGEFGLILASRDRGDTWQQVASGDESLFAMHLDFSGPGYAVGQDGAVLRSLDGGWSWQKLDAGVRANLLDVWASPENEVVVVGMRSLLRSSDAGDTWRLLKGRTVERSWYQALAPAVVDHPIENGAMHAVEVYAVGQMGNIVTVGRQ